VITSFSRLFLATFLLSGCKLFSSNTRVQTTSAGDLGFCSAEKSRFAFNAGSESVPTLSGGPLSNCEDVCVENLSGNTASIKIPDGSTRQVQATYLNESFPDTCAQKFAFAVERLADRRAFESISFPSNGIIKGNAVKFLIDRSTGGATKLQFINSRFLENGEQPPYVRMHYAFARKAFGFSGSEKDFNNVTYSNADKKFLAGTLQMYQMPQRSFFGVSFFPEDHLNSRDILTVMRTVRKAVAFEHYPLRMVATGAAQDYRPALNELRSEGFDVLTLDDVIGNLDYLAMNHGEAFGRLRMFPKDPDTLEPIDIPVFSELPLDLSVVSGVITKAFQDNGAHVNLKSKERGTPNMILRSASAEHPMLKGHDGEFIRLTVTSGGFSIEKVTEAVALQKLAERMAAKPRQRLAVGSDTVIRAYSEMCAGAPQLCLAAGAAQLADSMSARYGSKAANLGFLSAATSVSVRNYRHTEKIFRHQQMTGSINDFFGYKIVPSGVGIPMSIYQKFLDKNPSLKQELNLMIDDVMKGRLSPIQLAERSRAVRESFYKGQLPDGMLSQIRDALAKASPNIQRFKIRSSANAEDIEGFDGAGLHDSFSANLSNTDDSSQSCKFEVSTDSDGEAKGEMKPKSLACAIRGVYASLWNKRAIEERTFANIDQTTAAMGLAIVPKYDIESEIAANAVLITRIINAGGLFGYTLSVQKGNTLVTNPTTGTLAESSFANFYNDALEPVYTLIRYAKPIASQPALNNPVLSKAQMNDLVTFAQTIETLYCSIKPAYSGNDCARVVYNQRKPKSLDMEFKILANGRIVAKQVREFSGQ
jgi:hypothetical protein